MTTGVTKTSGFCLSGPATFPESEGKYSSVLNQSCLPVASSVQKVFTGMVGEHFCMLDDVPFGPPRLCPAFADDNFESFSDSEASSDEDELERSSQKKYKTLPELEKVSQESEDESEDVGQLLESLGNMLNARGSSASALRGILETVWPNPSMALKKPENNASALDKDPSKDFRPSAPKLLAQDPPYNDLRHFSSLNSLVVPIPSRMNQCNLEPNSFSISEPASSTRPVEDVSRGNIRNPRFATVIVAPPESKRRKFEERSVEELPKQQEPLAERCLETPRASKQKKTLSISKSPAFQRRNGPQGIKQPLNKSVSDWNSF